MKSELKVGLIVVAPATPTRSNMRQYTANKNSEIGLEKASNILESLGVGALGRTRTGTALLRYLRILSPVISFYKLTLSLEIFNFVKTFGRIVVAVVRPKCANAFLFSQPKNSTKKRKSWAKDSLQRGGNNASRENNHRVCQKNRASEKEGLQV